MIGSTAVEALLIPVLGRGVVVEPLVIMSWIGVVFGIVFVGGIARGGRRAVCVPTRGIGGNTGGREAGRGGLLTIGCKDPSNR